MRPLLVYSFRTNKHLQTFENKKIKVFVFGELKKDLLKFQELINELNPKIIIGLAEIKSNTRLETTAINSFGNNKKISRSETESFKLHILQNNPFLLSATPTKSFCNWTMYKISELIQGKDIRLSFIHFNQKDISKMISLIKRLSNL